MNHDIDKDSLLNATVLFAAWLVVIAACINPNVDATATVVRIAYVE